MTPRHELTVDDVDRLTFDLEGQPALQRAVLLGAFLGLRAGEAVSLDWSDFDLDEQTVRIRNPKARDPEVDRTLPIPPGLVDRLGGAGEGNVLTGAPTPLALPPFLRRMSRAMYDLGLPGSRYHDLRHFAATRHPRLA